MLFSEQYGISLILKYSFLIKTCHPCSFTLKPKHYLKHSTTNLSVLCPEIINYISDCQPLCCRKCSHRSSSHRRPVGSFGCHHTAWRSWSRYQVNSCHLLSCGVLVPCSLFLCSRCHDPVPCSLFLCNRCHVPLLCNLVPCSHSHNVQNMTWIHNTLSTYVRVVKRKRGEGFRYKVSNGVSCHYRYIPSLTSKPDGQSNESQHQQRTHPSTATLGTPSTRLLPF